MCVRFLIRMAAVVGPAAVLVVLISRMMCPAAVARPIDSSARPAAVITDTRWLNLITLIAPSRRSDAATPTLHLHLTDQVVAGQVASSAAVVISVTRSGQTIESRQVTPFPAAGSFMYVSSILCYDVLAAPSGGGGPYCNALFPDDVVWVSQAGAVVSLTVPTLTALADATADEVYGLAPISQSVRVYLYPAVTPEIAYTQTAIVDADGQYRASYTPTLDVRPHDTGYVMYAAASDRAAYVRFVAPQLHALVGGLEAWGYVAPNAAVAITITRSDDTPRNNLILQSGSDGRFLAAFGGSAVLQPGEHVVAMAGGQVISMTVMTLTAQIDLASGRVTGETLPDQPIELRRFAGPVDSGQVYWSMQTPIEQTAITSTAAGQYTATLSLARPNFGLATITLPDGNQVSAYFVVPYVRVRLGGGNQDVYSIVGQVNEVLTPLTMTIQGASGYPKDVRYSSAGASGYFYDVADHLRLEAGDVLTVASAHGASVVFTAPELAGQMDPETDVISGTAPPDTPVTLIVNYYEAPSAPGSGYPPPPLYGYTVAVTSDAAGRYHVDLHGVIDLVWYSTGEAQVTTSDGYLASRPLDALPMSACMARLTDAVVNGNFLSVIVSGNCQSYGQIFIRLWAANGTLKAERQAEWYGFGGGFGFGVELRDSAGRPIGIAPTDRVELEWSEWSTLPTPTPWPVFTPTGALSLAQSNTQVQSYTVPTLTAYLDLNANTIVGQGPVSRTLDVILYGRITQYFTVAADALGNYQIDVSGIDVLAAGYRAQAAWRDGLGVRWYTYDAVPLLSTRLGDNSLKLTLPPLSPFTLTIQSASGASWTMASRIAQDGQAYLYAPNLIGVGDRLTLTTPETVTTLLAPDLVARIDRAAARVYGQAPPNARLRVELTPSAQSQWVTATASGYYSVTFPGLAPLAYANGTLTYDANGMIQMQLNFSTGRWSVALGERCIDGVGEMAGKPLTVTLESPPGTAREVITRPASYGNQFAVCFTRAVETGDRLVLAYQPDVTSALVLPALTARHDFARQLVLGQTLADTPVDLQIPAIAVTRRVWSDEYGDYGADVSDRTLPVGTIGSVGVTDTEGNLIIRRFSVIGLARYLPVLRK